MESIEILNIPFALGDLEETVAAALDLRGMLTAPSAPCLGIAVKEPRYTQQLAASKIVIADSGAMILMWRLVYPSCRLKRISGLAFLEALLRESRLREPGALFLVDPSVESSARNRRFLNRIGIPLEGDYQYVAPQYAADSVEDPVLFQRLAEVKPRYVLINLGGGIQERLGAWLQSQWQAQQAADELPAIFCTGAAIAFLTGEQTRIPGWADRMYLGWAVRCLWRAPVYVPRYFKSIPVLYYTLKDAAVKRLSRKG